MSMIQHLPISLKPYLSIRSSKSFRRLARFESRTTQLPEQMLIVGDAMIICILSNRTYHFLYCRLCILNPQCAMESFGPSISLLVKCCLLHTPYNQIPTQPNCLLPSHLVRFITCLLEEINRTGFHVGAPNMPSHVRHS